MARRNNGTHKGGARRPVAKAIDTLGNQDARGPNKQGKDWQVTDSHARRYRNPKHGPAGSNPKGEAAGRKARAGGL